MSHKFFTWTKGDRRNATEALQNGGVVTIPAELRINGMEYARDKRGSSKSSRKPLPLPLEQSPPSRHQSAPSESIVLHDAAVRSATSLMAVMNDMLRSPPISAHLAAQQQSASLHPVAGRPRSHTAPSTPLAEAPVAEPVELPGSILLDQKSMVSLHQSYDSQTYAASTNSLADTHVGHSIERPHSSPQHRSYTFSTESRRPMATTQHGLCPPSQPSPRSKSASPARSGRITGVARGFSRSADTLVESQASVKDPIRSRRPSLGVIQSTSLLPPLSKPQQCNSTVPSSQPMDQELELLSSIAQLRSSHENHIQLLKEVHERELDSHRTYITLLERHANAQQHSGNSWQKGYLTIDTSHGAGKTADLRSTESATTLQSFETALDAEKRPSQEIIATSEIESLKRKLSLAHKAQSETADIKRERDYYRESSGKSDKRIWQLKDIIKKAKENEKSYKNALDNLEARLEEANNSRIDALAGFGDASEQVTELQAKLEKANTQLQDLRNQYESRNQSAPAEECRGVFSLDGSTLHGSSRERAPPAQSSTDERRIKELESHIQELLQRIATLQGERDRFNSLLHAELRRSTRQAAQKAHQATPEIKAEAFVHVSETVAQIKREGHAQPTQSVDRTDQTTSVLEKELEHCVKEIILYKLDIKGYKKDIKKAQAKIEALQQASAERTFVDTPPNNDSTDGLGISLYTGPSTPAQPITQATKVALLAASPPAVIELKSRASEPSWNGHKRLPKPPHSRTPSPSPGHCQNTSARTPGRSQRLASGSPGFAPSTPLQRAQRQETLRSLSESIISSYAQRDPPEQVPQTPVTRARSSDPSLLPSHHDSGVVVPAQDAKFLPDSTQLIAA